MKAFFITVAFLVLAGAIAYAAYSPWGQRTALTWERDKPFSLPKILTQSDVQIHDIPAVVEALSSSDRDVAYATFAFTPNGGSYDDGINLNLSIEDGHVGFDWVLLGQPNIDDLDQFIAFARSKGVDPKLHQMNGVEYYRVTEVAVDDFTSDVITEMYEIPPDYTLGLYHDGFAWPE